MNIDPEKQFQHRPISVTVTEVMSMDSVRMIPAEATLVTVNVKLDQKHARDLAKLILEKVLVDDVQKVDLVTFSLRGTLK